jgi:hypothetical protein
MDSELSEPGWREIMVKTSHFSPVSVCSEKRQLALRLSVCVCACDSAALTRPIFMKFDIWDIYLTKSVQEIQFSLKWDKNIGGI